MNKRITNIIMGLLLVLFMGVLVGCPTEAPKEKDKSGGGGDPSAGFAISNEYIDFHSYYAEVSNNTGQSFDKVVFVVSTKSTSRDLVDIDPTAKVIRNFGANQTRKIYIGWTDEFSKTKYETVKGTTTAKDNQYLLSNEASYTAVPWIIRANKPYFVHAYYEGKIIISKAFSTPDYPNTPEEAETMFKGDMVGGLFNTGLNSFKKKAAEPSAIAFGNSWKVDKGISFRLIPQYGFVLFQYLPTIGSGSFSSIDCIYFIFGDDTDLLFNATPAHIFDMMYFGYQNITRNGKNITGYRVTYGAENFNRAVPIIPIVIDDVIEDWTTEDIPDGVRITAYTGTDTSIIIPTNVGGKKVIEIQGAATGVGIFGQSTGTPNTAITSVDIYNATHLKSINFSAFANSTGLAKVVLPNTLETIGASVFAATAITNITLPPALISIGDGAFSGNTQLNDVTILRKASPITTAGVGIFAGTPMADNTKISTVHYPEGTGYKTADGWKDYYTHESATNFWIGR